MCPTFSTAGTCLCLLHALRWKHFEELLRNYITFLHWEFGHSFPWNSQAAARCTCCATQSSHQPSGTQNDNLGSTHVVLVIRRCVLGSTTITRGRGCFLHCGLSIGFMRQCSVLCVEIAQSPPPNAIWQKLSIFVVKHVIIIYNEFCCKLQACAWG